MELIKKEFDETKSLSKKILFLKSIKDYLFPNYYNEVKDKDLLLLDCKKMFLDYISNDLEKQKKFFSSLDNIYDLLLQDLQMTFDCDPAANNLEEVLTTYPGMNAIITHRIAHVLYELDEKTASRAMSEYAHSKTGIDIHPGANIGHHFFIDHGTGIVIGETTTIGNYVRVYQGVTLGALSLSDGHNLNGVKRHPSIGNNVIIYANASILGGNTIIGDNVTIGGNVFITKSIPSDITVINKEPELIFKNK